MITQDGRELEDGEFTINIDKDAAGRPIMIVDGKFFATLDDVIKLIRQDRGTAEFHHDTEREKTEKQARAAETKIEDMGRLIVSAQTNVQTALAIAHLERHAGHALAGNRDPNRHSALTAAHADLERALERADIVPF